MGAESLGTSLNCTKEKAQKFIDDFFAGYPTVHKFIEESNAFARKNGYVDGIMGRRRRLPDILLPRYSVSRKGASELFNPILGTDKVSEKREDSIVKKYKDKVAKSKGWREVKEITEEAKKEGVVISNNGGFISRAERQAVNSKIQGGAATITKLAMLNIDRDEELNRLGFRTLICVHDEVIGECPSENASRVAERLQEVMVDSAKDVCSVRMKCDLYKVYRWYADDFSNTVKEMYDKAIEKGTNSVSAKNEILHKYDFVSASVLDDMISGNFDIETRTDI